MKEQRITKVLKWLTECVGHQRGCGFLSNSTVEETEECDCGFSEIMNEIEKGMQELEYRRMSSLLILFEMKEDELKRKKIEYEIELNVNKNDPAAIALYKSKVGEIDTWLNQIDQHMKKIIKDMRSGGK